MHSPEGASNPKIACMQHQDQKRRHKWQGEISVKGSECERNANVCVSAPV